MEFGADSTWDIDLMFQLGVSLSAEYQPEHLLLLSWAERFTSLSADFYW